jgi:predicted nucleic acid-binding protein
MYLIDTDWVAEYLKAIPAAVQTLQRLAPAGIAVSLITYGEILEGITFGRNPKTEAAGLRQFLRLTSVLPLNRSIMRHFASVRGNLRRQGLLIGDMDILIAATALHHNLTLVTHNVRHFQRISGLTLYPSTR